MDAAEIVKQGVLGVGCAVEFAVIRHLYRDNQKLQSQLLEIATKTATEVTELSNRAMDTHEGVIRAFHTMRRTVEELGARISRRER